MKYMDYKEEKPHGTFDFPFEFYHFEPSDPQSEMVCHWHIEYEIIRILDGEFLMTLDEKHFSARPNDLIFIRGGLLHGGVPKNCRYEGVVFNLDSLMTSNSTSERFLKELSNDAFHINPLFSLCDDQLKRITDTIFEQLTSQKPGRELTVIGAFYELFGYLKDYRLYSKREGLTQRNSARIKHLKKALKLIETSYADCLTLETLSKEAGMNAKYFCRYFREMTQRTPIDYLNYYRVEQACLKLTTSNDSIAEIGLSCGFNDVSYFIKIFKKYKGVTPKKYIALSNTNSL